MPRATTKKELIQMANEQFDKLQKMIDGLSEEEQLSDFCYDAAALGTEAHWERDKNLRDVLIHLYEWHQLLITWESANARGENTPFLPAPYTWKTYGEMNQEFTKKHQSTSLASAKNMLNESHRQVLLVIDKYSDEELFTKALFKWTGTSSLGQYCISATVSHYEWATKKLKKARR